MQQTFIILAYPIKLNFNKGLIRIYSNAALWALLKNDKYKRLAFLCQEIKTIYFKKFGVPLKISQKSLMLEIAIHVYCDYLGLLFKQLCSWSIIHKLLNKLIKRAEIVDCGELKLDSNRWFWDILSPLAKLFIYLLPSNLNANQLKKY